MHTAMVSHKGGKMSKFLGNLVLVRDLLKIHIPGALRLYLAAVH
jgi:cysteinyl-tRNA synthetase